MFKILTIVGARPQFIKAAVVSRNIALHNIGCCNDTDRIQELIVHTGQHYDENMSDVFFKEMHIPKPAYNLGVGGSRHGAMTGRMMEKIEEIILDVKPGVVLVYGDTNSTLAGALAAAKLHVPVAHVEAGLRSYNMAMPEEINRILTDEVSTWLFCPSDNAMRNLKKAGFFEKEYNKIRKISNVGDVMYDAVLHYVKNTTPSTHILHIAEAFNDGFYLATVHRAENTEDPIKITGIMHALDTISNKIPVVLPLHPRTKKVLQNTEVNTNNIKFIEPVGYIDMLALLSRCKGVFTDSGGLQKEAYFFNKLCITLREETEWVELVENKYNILTGADFDKIIKAEKMLAYAEITFKPLYGTGQAGANIIKELLC